jgi:hypothetical protein
MRQDYEHAHDFAQEASYQTPEPGCVFDLPLAYNVQGVSSEEPRPRANSGLLLVRYVNVFGN